MGNADRPEGKPQQGVPFELNGDKLFAPSEKMRSSDLLNIAWEMKTLPFEPDKYQLVSTKDGTVYKAEDYVDLEVVNQFLAQPTTPTQVAEGRS